MLILRYKPQVQQTQSALQLNKPGKIENYTPGKSSISESEAKKVDFCVFMNVIASFYFGAVLLHLEFCCSGGTKSWTYSMG